MEVERDTPYQPLDNSMSSVNSSGSGSGSTSRQVNDNGADHNKDSGPSSLDGSPTPLMRDGSGSTRTHFDVSSESGGGSDVEGGLKMGKAGRGPKKTISFWVSLVVDQHCEANRPVGLSLPGILCTALL